LVEQWSDRKAAYNVVGKAVKRTVADVQAAVKERANAEKREAAKKSKANVKIQQENKAKLMKMAEDEDKQLTTRAISVFECPLAGHVAIRVFDGDDAFDSAVNDKTISYDWPWIVNGSTKVSSLRGGNAQSEAFSAMLTRFVGQYPQNLSHARPKVGGPQDFRLETPGAQGTGARQKEEGGGMRM